MSKPIYTCRFCGKDTDIPPEDQVMPDESCLIEEDDSRISIVREDEKPEFYD